MFILIFLFCAALLATMVTGSMILHAAQGSTGQVSHLIVLGCSVFGDVPSPMLNDRIQKAANWLTENPSVICVVSGGKGKGENLSEAQCMYQELTKLGIPGDRIWLEDRSTSTRENLAYSIRLIGSNTGTRPEVVGILSSEFHLLRADMFAQEQQVQAICIPAATSRPVVFWKYFLREILLVWYYSTLGRVI